MGSRKKKILITKMKCLNQARFECSRNRRLFVKKDCLRISMNRDVERISRDERGTCSH